MPVALQDPPEECPSGIIAPPNESLTGATGLKPIQRMLSADRLARIHPETLAQTELRYSSVFARDFLRSDYNFCAAKMTIARGGKLTALEAEFRLAESWFKKANAWVESRSRRAVSVTPETIVLEIKHPLSGRLVRLVSLYDQLFIRTLEGLMAQSVASYERQGALDNAESRIKKIAYLCIPDLDRYTPEGILLSEEQSNH